MTFKKGEDDVSPGQLAHVFSLQAKRLKLSGFFMFMLVEQVVCLLALIGFSCTRNAEEEVLKKVYFSTTPGLLRVSCGFSGGSERNRGRDEPRLGGFFFSKIPQIFLNANHLQPAFFNSILDPLTLTSLSCLKMKMLNCRPTQVR